MMFNDRRIRTVDNIEAYKTRRAQNAVERGTGTLPSEDSLKNKYGTKLPRAGKPRTDAEWNARASVISAARAGSIKKMPKKGK